VSRSFVRRALQNTHAKHLLHILFFGDIVGAIGRRALIARLPELRERYQADLVIANVENLAHGAGVTTQTLNDLVTAGVDAFTGGNHSWDNPLGAPLFEKDDWKGKLVVPTNYGGAKSGTNTTLLTPRGIPVLLINLMGRVFTHPDTTSPFQELLTLLEKPPAKEARVVLVDFHAEATSEKEAMGYFADGKVTAVLGTHTHVATADARLLPGGTAYVTDVGRCGAFQSVIGFDPVSVIPNFLAQQKQKFNIPTSGTAEVNGIALTVALDTGRAVSLDRIREFVDISA